MAAFEFLQPNETGSNQPDSPGYSSFGGGVVPTELTVTSESALDHTYAPTTPLVPESTPDTNPVPADAPGRTPTRDEALRELKSIAALANMVRTDLHTGEITAEEAEQVTGEILGRFEELRSIVQAEGGVAIVSSAGEAGTQQSDSGVVESEPATHSVPEQLPVATR